MLLLGFLPFRLFLTFAFAFALSFSFVPLLVSRALVHWMRPQALLARVRVRAAFSVACSCLEMPTDLCTLSRRGVPEAVESWV